MDMTHTNSIILVGRLVREVEVKEIRPGLKIGKMTIATDHIHTNKDGATTKETCFTECVVWNKMADRCGENLRRGSMVAIEGRLKLDTWKDKSSGEERSKHTVAVTNVVFMDPKDTTKTSSEPFSGFTGDELPF
jgi:single-strand DNA-binding protein